MRDLLGALTTILKPAARPLIQLFAVFLGFFSLLIVSSGLGGVQLARDPERLRNIDCNLELKGLTQAVEKFHSDCGRYPTAREGLSL